MVKRLMVMVLLLSTLVLSGAAGAQNAPVTIRWFVGLGTGINPDQIPPQQAIVDEFNASQDRIELEVTFVETAAAIDALSTLIASGNAPDIVGPVGVGGSNAFAGAWLDLQPLVDSTGYDLTQFDEAAVDFYRVPGEGLVGLPFGVFPSFLGYNKDLFDEAGLNYPPSEVGEMYVMPDGSEVAWDFDTLAMVARMLTVDANGYDATEDEFDPNNVAAYGYSDMFNDPRGHCALFGAGGFVDDDGNAVIPDVCREAWAWFYDGRFGEEPFMPALAALESDVFGNGNPFSVGRVAMAHLHLWYPPCCLGDQVERWGIGVLPAYDGTVTAKLHADNFRVLGTTQNPEEAFEVLLYLTDERGAELLQVYGGMPARRSDQAAFFETFAQNFDADVDWTVVSAMLGYADNPSHEGFLPNFNEADARIKAFGSLYQSDANLDLDAALEALRADLQEIFDRADRAAS